MRSALVLIVAVLLAVIIMHRCVAEPAAEWEPTTVPEPIAVQEPAVPPAAPAPALQPGPQGPYLEAPAWAYRSGGSRKRAVGKRGGSRAGEQAVNAGLRFLRRHQGEDGSWHPATFAERCDGAPRRAPGVGGADDQVALTARAVIAYSGAGYDVGYPSQFQRVLRQAVAWLDRRLDDTGAASSDALTQATVVQALAEVWGLSGDATRRAPTERALAALLRQRGADGGWGAPGAAGTRTTVAAVRAIARAAAAGTAVGDALVGARRWLADAWPEEQPVDAAHAGDVLELALRLGLPGRGALLAGVITAAELGTPPDLDRLLARRRALCLGDDPAWNGWNPPTRDAVVALVQIGDDCLDGSVDPLGRAGPLAARGRLQSTLDAIESLQVYYAEPVIRLAR